MIVRWDIWWEVVVPVLKEIAPLRQRASQEFDALVAQLEKAIREQMKERRFLPPDPEVPEPASLPNNGEFIVRSAPRGDPAYPILDVEAIDHPDGNPKLVYPLVDGGPKA
jgi:hypothetical protein